MSLECRVLPFRTADGPANMALDEALLDAVALRADAAAFRTYGWSEPTLSLGYFQRIEDAEAIPQLRGIPLVRRPTGGGALLHHHELTYAVVIPRMHPLARRAPDLYRAVHGAIADAIRGLGIPAERRGEVDAEKPPRRPFFCFTDRDAEDIVFQGIKVVGSAQRRRSGAVLQHGSLLLARSSVTPNLLGLGDLAQISSDLSGWSTRFRDAILAALALQMQIDEVTATESARAADLDRRVYRDPSWMRRR
jgi:lipoate-protein ligase A